jgi:hypothetical protein
MGWKRVKVEAATPLIADAIEVEGIRQWNAAIEAAIKAANTKDYAADGHYEYVKGRADAVRAIRTLRKEPKP